MPCYFYTDSKGDLALWCTPSNPGPVNPPGMPILVTTPPSIESSRDYLEQINYNDSLLSSISGANVSIDLDSIITDLEQFEVIGTQSGDVYNLAYVSSNATFDTLDESVLGSIALTEDIFTADVAIESDF